MEKGKFPASYIAPPYLPTTGDLCLCKRLAHFLKVYLDGAFLLCCSPFRLKLVNDSDDESQPSQYPHFIAVSWLPQQLLCLAFTLLHTIWLIRDIRFSFPTNAKNPSMYFEMFHCFINILWKMSIVKYLWFNRRDFLNIVNFIISPGNCLPNRSYYSGDTTIWQKFSSSKLLAPLLAFLYSGVSIAYWVAGRGVTKSTGSGQSTAWSPQWWWGENKEAARAIFFMSDAEAGRDSAWHSVLAVLAAAGSFQKRLLPFYSYFFFLTMVLTLRSAVKAFSSALQSSLETQPLMTMKLENSVFKLPQNAGKQLVVIDMKEKEEPPKWAYVRSQYQSLKTLADLINHPFGGNFTYFLMKIILFYPISFDEVFVELNPEWSKIVLLIFYVCNAAVILSYSAGICHQMSTMTAWMSLENNRRQIQSDELTLTAIEVGSHVVAIRASNVFPITHSLVANILGVTATYFIICVQI